MKQSETEPNSHNCGKCPRWSYRGCEKRNEAIITYIQECNYIDLETNLFSREIYDKITGKMSFTRQEIIDAIDKNYQISCEEGVILDYDELLENFGILPKEIPSNKQINRICKNRL
ncbi:hypothetical protein GF312_16225 [Candidatus Poribacteria bacterium]|nr:hypothetical protein [Candidatus Poribacteria bacterium]